MATITFDTLQFVRRLKAAGVSEEQAEAFAEAFKDAQGELDVATKADLKELEYRLTSKLYRALLLQTFALAGIIAAVLVKLP